MVESSHNQDGRSLRGAFITFEGIDGCGKTTQAEILAEKLRELNYAVLETREPGGTAIGRDLRKILLATRHQVFDEPDTANGEKDSKNVHSRFRGMDATCQLLLFFADRIQHLAEIIRPSLERGDTVICDRYHDATVAYQQYGRGLNLDYFRGIIEAEINSTPPEVTFLLDIDVDIAWGRARTEGNPYRQLAMFQEDEADNVEASADNKGSRKKLDPETKELKGFFRRVRKGYLAIQKNAPERIVLIDAGREIDHIAGEIWQALKDRYEVL